MNQSDRKSIEKKEKYRLIKFGGDNMSNFYHIVEGAILLNKSYENVYLWYFLITIHSLTI